MNLRCQNRLMRLERLVESRQRPGAESDLFTRIEALAAELRRRAAEGLPDPNPTMTAMCREAATRAACQEEFPDGGPIEAEVPGRQGK